MFDKPTKTKWMALSLVTYSIVSGSPACATSQEQLIAVEKVHQPLLAEQTKKSYTINFNNVSIKEYLKFISKIADLNFIYDEADLNFNVTIVSEEPADLSNILSALLQVLKIHELSLVDDGVNLVINRQPNTPQLAQIISESTQDMGHLGPLVTRVFKVKNANPSSILSILQSLLSQTAFIELSKETRHIIITDSSLNVEKVSELLKTLDAPQSPLEIGVYQSGSNNALNLVTLATQIVLPLSEGNPLIMVPQQSSNTVFVVSTPFLIEKTLSILKELDKKPLATKEKILLAENILLYQLQYKSADVMLRALKDISSNLTSLGYSSEGLVVTFEKAKYIPETNSILFTGDPVQLKKVLDLITSVDVPGKPLPNSQNSSFFIYKPVNRSASEFSEILDQFASNLDSANFTDYNLILSIKGSKIVPSVDSILFTGDIQTITEVQSVLKTLDVPAMKELINEKFFIYHIQTASHEQLAKSLTNVADNLENSNYPDKALIHAIDSMQWIPETNSLFFVGDEAALKQLKDMLPSFDVSTDALLDFTEFLMYTPINIDGETLLQSIETLSKNLQESGLANPILLRTLQNARWIPSTKAIVFTGPPETLARIKTLMPTIDRTSTSTEKSTVFIYHPTNVTLQELVNSLNNLADNLPHEDDLYTMLETLRAAQDSQSVVLRGTPEAITKLQEILKILDSSEQSHLSSSNDTYFIYKLKETSGDIIIKDLDKIIKNLRASGFDDKDFTKAINSIEWIKSTNSIYVSGNPESLKKIKDLLEEFDVKTLGQIPSEYLIYKPTKLSAKETLQKLSALQKGLQSSGLSNPELLASLSSVEYVELTDSLIFSGTPAAILSVKEILNVIESELEGTSIKDVGKKTYLIYKLKYLTGPQLIGYLRNVSQDLVENKTDESNLVVSIQSARYISEANSVIFTGTQSSLQELQLVIDKFDISSLAISTTVNPPQAYLVYQPTHLPAGALITILHDFEKQVMNSGLHEPDLFNTINNLKLLEKTGSITLSGTDTSVKQVEDLLKKFDVPSNAEVKDKEVSTIGSLHTDMSFLIYKLKYHQGSEIEDALKKIASELSKNEEKGISNPLIQAIESIQWIQVTNSLLGTGNASSLAKLKNLIENIDVPLQQIFIEVLVVETNLTSALDFGLRWAGQGNFKNKLGYSTGAFPFTAGTDQFANFNQTLQSTNASTTPTGSSIPFSSGFGLGVIGDLIYHKGQSYTALGSLIDCLRQDIDSTIILSQKVIAQDNQPATVFTGDNIPFTGSTVQNVSSNATVFSTNLEYKDIGVSLSITPRVGDDGLISINIDQEISEALNMGNTSTASIGSGASGGQITNPNVNGITTSKTSMQTQATIPDKHFLVFSGLMRNQKVKTRSGIPCLGGLPVIGAAFSSTNITTVKKNVIIFVRPEIIQNFKTYKNITERQEDLFRSQTTAEDFDEGLELVKTPDDE
jgi:type III secretion protein C